MPRPQVAWYIGHFLLTSLREKVVCLGEILTWGKHQVASLAVVLFFEIILKHPLVGVIAHRVHPLDVGLE